MSRARTIADFGDGIATADIDDGAVTAAKIGSLPAGSVLQVVEGTVASDTSTSSATFVDSGLSATITPSSASSKILIVTSQRLTTKRPDPFVSGYTGLYRGATELASQIMGYTTDQGLYGNDMANSVTFTYLDSPSTTSATTYKTRIRIASGFFSNTVATGTDRGSIILMEIAG